VITNPTCAGADVIEAIGPGIEHDQPIVCRLTDGGVGFSIGVIADRARRYLMAMAMVTTRNIRQMSPADHAREITRMDDESRTDREHWTTPGLIRRAPDRARGRFVRLEGEARNVHESNGVTSLELTTDPIGRERWAVSMPAVADDRIVDRARVRAYGIFSDAPTEEGPLGAEVVPVVFAVELVPIADPPATQ